MTPVELEDLIAAQWKALAEDENERHCAEWGDPTMNRVQTGKGHLNQDAQFRRRDVRELVLAGWSRLRIAEKHGVSTQVIGQDIWILRKKGQLPPSGYRRRKVA